MEVISPIVQTAECEEMGYRPAILNCIKVQDMQTKDINLCVRVLAGWRDRIEKEVGAGPDCLCLGIINSVLPALGTQQAALLHSAPAQVPSLLAVSKQLLAAEQAIRRRSGGSHCRCEGSKHAKILRHKQLECRCDRNLKAKFKKADRWGNGRRKCINSGGLNVVHHVAEASLPSMCARMFNHRVFTLMAAGDHLWGAGAVVKPLEKDAEPQALGTFLTSGTCTQTGDWPAFPLCCVMPVGGHFHL